MIIHIYTDGSCRKGYGGWAYIMFTKDGYYSEGGGNMATTTNNRAEMYSVIAALSRLPRQHDIIVWNDSRYVIDGASIHLPSWFCDKKLVRHGLKNADLWERILFLQELHHIQWRWVKGHNNNLWNEYVDLIAYFYCTQALYLRLSNPC